MFSCAKQFFVPPARRGSFSAVTDLGVAVERLAFVASLWWILLTALSPNTKTFITLFTIRPISSPFFLFSNIPTPPSRVAKPIKPPRREEVVESTSNPPSLALFVCFAVAHTITRHAQNVLGTQQKPAVSDGRGTEESLDIIPIHNHNPTSDGKSLSKPAVCNGRGIEESSDVTTTPIHESTSNDGDVDTNKTTGKLNHNGTHEDADTSATNVQDLDETVALTISYILAAAEKTDDEQLHALARRIRTHHLRHVTPEDTTSKLTQEVNDESTGTETEATTERFESIEKEREERDDVAESEKSIKSDEDVEEEDEVEETKGIEEEPEVIDDQDTQDEVTDECTTIEVASHNNCETESEGVEEKDEVEEMKETDDQDATDEVTDENAERETDSEELGFVATESKEMAAEKQKNVQAAAALPEEDASWDANEDDVSGKWFTMRKGKAVKTLSRPVPTPPVPAPTSSTSEDVDAATSPPAVAGNTAPESEESATEVSAAEPQNTATEKDGDWYTVCAEELPAVPPAASNAFKEAEKAVKRAKVEEEEQKAKEVEEAKVARISKFDTTMGQLGGLLKAARGEKQKLEQKNEENEKTIKGIGSAQNRIGEMIDMEKVRAMFDPKVLKTSSFSSVAVQDTVIPKPEIAPLSSSVTHTDNASADKSSALQLNAADRPGPPRVLPRDSGVRQGATGTKKTIERRLRRQRNELRRRNAEAALTSNSGDGGESPKRDGA